jgi:hypothetical protein
LTQRTLEVDEKDLGKRRTNKEEINGHDQRVKKEQVDEET